jgi:hypothetical protein
MQLPTIQRTILLTGPVFRASFLRPPELPPWQWWWQFGATPNDVLRGSSSRSGTAGLRVSVWRTLLQIAASLLALKYYC